MMGKIWKLFWGLPPALRVGVFVIWAGMTALVFWASEERAFEFWQLMPKVHAADEAPCFSQPSESSTQVGSVVRGEEMRFLAMHGERVRIARKMGGPCWLDRSALSEGDGG